MFARRTEAAAPSAMTEQRVLAKGRLSPGHNSNHNLAQYVAFEWEPSIASAERAHPRPWLTSHKLGRAVALASGRRVKLIGCWCQG
jgi:hypothetical protein